ncbi:MAG: sialate O-acetylesterase, partial [Planctomycetes bacterium]|nr:sialate O-acetylesterase [Planctomycetota bacterium]
QSNMAMPIDWGVFGAWDSPECQKILAEVDLPNIRMFMVEKSIAGEPAADVSGQWKVCRNREILKWSAVGYFFGRQLHEKLNVPIGLIRSAVGGTPIESWMSSESLVAVMPETKPKLEQWAKQAAAFDESAYQKELAAWQEAVAKAKVAGQKEPRKPSRVIDNAWRPCSLYNGMIRPLMPYGIRGVIWYQGESNASKAADYRVTFPAMIRAWRSEWGQDEFPFLFVQLANFKARQDQPSESAWAELREAQRLTLSVPKTAMAVAIDIGEANDIHPKNKQDVGKRLALGALTLAYDQKLVYSGPIVSAAKADGGKVRLSFDHVGGGLTVKGGEPLKGFAVAGADGKYVWAQARIDGAEVVVSSDEVAKPTAVRYAWADNPECNLYNAEGLPASPFQVDVGQ